MKTFINYLNENKIQPIMKTKNGCTFWVIPNTEKDKLSYKGYGVLHRENGPAKDYNNGYKQWFINGICHREDGPAIEWSFNTIDWYLNGAEIDPTSEMMSKYIRLNPDNIFRRWDWPKEIQALAIELGGEKIRLELIKKKLLHPDLYGKLDNLNKRGFFS